MNEKVVSILEKIKTDYNSCDAILVFGSALSTEWNEKSDIDIFLVDDSFEDSRFESEYDGITVEFQKDNYSSIKEDIEDERGALLNRNVSTMIATSKVLSSRNPDKVDEIVNLAKDVLSSNPKYNDEDIKMWRYSILDYISKAEKDVLRNDEIAFYMDTHYVLQNALEMSLAINGVYMPQPKYLMKLLEEKDPDFLKVWLGYINSHSMEEKLRTLLDLRNR